MSLKELAKFFAGVTAWESLVHASLASCNMLPLQWCGFTLTPTLNTIQIIIPCIVSMFLIWYGWVRTGGSRNA